MENTSPIKQFNPDKYRIVNSITENVSTCRKKGELKLFVLKKISAISTPPEKILNEFFIGKTLNHINFARTYKHYTDQNNKHYIIMENIDGELFCDFVKKQKITDKDFKKIVTQIFNAMIYCLNKNIAPLDLNDKNIIIDYNYKLTFIDFGQYTNVNDAQPDDYTYGLISFIFEQVLSLHSISNIPQNKFTTWFDVISQKFPRSKDETIEVLTDLLNHPFIKDM